MKKRPVHRLPMNKQLTLKNTMNRNARPNIHQKMNPAASTSGPSGMSLPSNGTPPFMGSKPVLEREARTVLTLKADAFEKKKLCDGITLNLGDACPFTCAYCYVPAAMRKLLSPILQGQRHEEVVVRRKDALTLLRQQLYRADGTPRYSDPADDRIAYSSTLVDVAANMTLVRETIEACLLILKATNWQIRLLSKSSLLRKVAEALPPSYRSRVIFGFSTGILDDKLCAVIEMGTAKVSKRIEALHWLQDNGFRTFGMICPSLPQSDYLAFASEAAHKLRVDRCEEVWAEVMNVRGESLHATIMALQSAGLLSEAFSLAKVCGDQGGAAWEDYARATFLAHASVLPAGKLRFLQYVNPRSVAWWQAHESKGAVLLGAHAP
jgi:DNA repair photolyase